MQFEKNRNIQSISVLNDSDLVFSVTPVQQKQNAIDLSNTFDINFMDEEEDEYRNQEQSRSKYHEDQIRVQNEDYLDGIVNRRALFNDNQAYFKEDSDSVIPSPKLGDQQYRESIENRANLQSQSIEQRKTSIQTNSYKDNNTVQKSASNRDKQNQIKEGANNIQDNRIIRIQQNDQSILVSLDQVLLQNSIKDQESDNLRNNTRNNGLINSDYNHTQISEFDNHIDQQEGLFVQKNFKPSKFNTNFNNGDMYSQRQFDNTIHQTNLQDSQSIAINSQYFQAECHNIATITQSQLRKHTQLHDKLMSEDGMKSQFAINASQQSYSLEKGKINLEDLTQDMKLKQNRETTPSNKPANDYSTSVFKKMNLLRLTNKFIELMKKNSRMTLYKRLRPNHIRIINDKSVSQFSDKYNDADEIQNFNFKESLSSRSFFTSNFKNKSKKSKKEILDFDGMLVKTENILLKIVKQQIKTMEKQINKVPTIPPDNGLLLIWNIIMFFSLIVLIFYIPIECAFKVFDSDIMQQLGVLLITSDTIIKFNTGFFKDGYVVQQRTKIFIEIITFQLWFNLISIFSLLSSPSDGSQFLFMINVFSVFNLMEKFDNYFQFKQRFFVYYEVIKLVFLVCFLASTFGSLFFLISEKQVERGERNAWILTKQINNWHDGYIFSLYFMFITMSTVGYGDLTPMNQAEVVFVGIIAMLSSCVFAYCINTIGNMLVDISQRESSFKQRKKDVLQYLNSRNISRNLQTKIIRYLEYLKNIENSQSHINADDIMKFFSDNLKFEVNKEFFGKQLRESKVFGLNFTHPFLNSLAQTMKEITLAPGDILYQKNESDNRILFLTSGDIELFEKEVRLRLLEKGEVLNYRGFFGNFSHSSSARSLTISHLSYCTKDDLINVLKTFPQDYESYCFMRDEMMLYNRTIDSKCCSCQSYSHTFQECPLIHYRINKDIVLRRWNYSSMNERHEFQRRKLKYKSFINLQVVKNKLKQQL